MARSLRLALALVAALVLGLAGARAAAPAPVAQAHPLRGLLPASPLAARAATVPPPLSYHGGAVLHQSTAYALFWSPPGYPMPAANVAAYTRYLQDQQASTSGSAYAVVTQYFDAHGAAGTSSAFGGALTATDPVPASECTDNPVIALPQPISVCVTQSTLDKVVAGAAAAHGIAASASPIFFIFLPPGMGTCSDDGSTCAYSEFAAYHSETDSDLLYAVLPYFAEARYESVAHEHIETITDPYGDAWFVDNGGEIADLCQGLAHTSQTLGTTPYTLPLEWSNASGACTAQAPPPTSPLTVATTGKGTGAVAASFSGQTLTCPTSTRGHSCVTVARQGAQVALAALPDFGFAFGGWDAKTPCTVKRKARCTFTTTATHATVTASFAVSHANEVYLLSVDVAGRGAVVLPDGKRCRTSCLESVTGGKALVLTAIPAKGWKLRAMRDDTHTCGTKPRCVLHLKASNNVTATFVRR